MSKTILADVDGFTPLVDSIVNECGITAASIFGRMWRYCQMKDGLCKAPISKIAEGLGEISRMTVIRHIDTLCEKGYLLDTTPSRRNRPHAYVDTGKASIKINISVSQNDTATVTNLDSEVSQNDTATVTKSDLKIEEKKGIKKEGKKPERRGKPRDPLLDHPAVVAFRDIVHLTPNELQRTEIARRIGDNGQIDQWRESLTKYIVSGKNPRNVSYALDIFEGKTNNGKTKSGGVTLLDAIKQSQMERAANGE